MRLLLRIIINSLAVYVAAQIVGGVKINSFLTAIVVSVVLGLLNTFIKPVLIILSLPITILTLGLFTFVINAIIILLVSNLVPGFTVSSFLSALVFSVVMSIIGWFFHILV